MKILGRDVTVSVDKTSGRVTEGPGLRRARAIIAIIGLIAGVVIITGAGVLMHRQYLDEFFFRRATAQGRVIANRYFVDLTRSRDMPKSGYRAVVAFQTSEGREVAIDAFFSTANPRYAIGQWLPVYYDPAEPQHAIVDEGLPTYLITIMPLLMGFFMLLGGVQGLLRRN